MNLQEVYAYLDNLKQQGDILDYSIVQDAGDKNVKTILQNIRTDLRTNYNVKLFESTRLDEQKSVVWVNAYCETNPKVLTLKQFAVKVKADGTYIIYEIAQ